MVEHHHGTAAGAYLSSTMVRSANDRKCMNPCRLPEIGPPMRVTAEEKRQGKTLLASRPSFAYALRMA